MRMLWTTTIMLGMVIGMNSGCSRWATPQAPNSGGSQSSIEILPFSTRSAIALTAYDILAIMRAANFTDAQIVTYGPAVRHALMTLGGAQVRIHYKGETRVPVQFVVREDDYVLIYSLESGYFPYDARNHVFGSRQPTVPMNPPGPTPVQ